MRNEGIIKLVTPTEKARYESLTVVAVLMLAVAASAVEIEPTTTTFFGPWSQGALGNYRYAARGDGQAWVDWRFEDLDAGWYEITATHVPYPNRASNAPYKVVTTGYAATVGRIDQRRGRSVVVGVVGVRTSGAVTVRLSNMADGYVIAQGVTLRKLEPAGTLTAWWCRDLGDGVDPEEWYRLFVGEEPPTFGSNSLIWFPTAGAWIAYSGPLPIIGLPTLEAGEGPVKCLFMVRVAP